MSAPPSRRSLTTVTGSVQNENTTPTYLVFAPLHVSLAAVSLPKTSWVQMKCFSELFVESAVFVSYYALSQQRGKWLRRVNWLVLLSPVADWFSVVY